MFPKAHAAAYVISAVKLGWYKIYYPKEFYATMFTVRGGDLDAEIVMKGHEHVRKTIGTLQELGNKRTAKETGSMEMLMQVNEMMARGIEFLPVDLMLSHSHKYVIEDGKIRIPFSAINGIGGNVADSLYKAVHQGDFISIEELLQRDGVTKSTIDTLESIGAIGNISRTNQLTLF
jgi:DNA polymerase-3 subunit alpha (Gram-positive type)